MYLLAIAIPQVRRIRLPVSRDQLMLLMAAVNEIFLGVDISLAHSISGAITAGEWIPILFGPTAGALLLVAGWISLRRRPAATVLATVVFILSIIVGLLGAYFHFIRAILPFAPAGQRFTVDLLIWAPPILGPLTFCLVGILGISAAWIEDPVDSGTLVLLGGRRLHLPYSKTQAYLFLVGLGSLATVISSVLDHARTGFANPWVWVPTTAGILGTVIPLLAAVINPPSRWDTSTLLATFLVLVAVGVVGAVLHVRDDLTAQGTFIAERFIRGAPFLAPLLFSNMGMLGLIAMLDPRESDR